MSLSRASSDKDRARLKLAVRRQVKACGGQESAASITRVGPQTLSDYGNSLTDRHRDTHCPLDVLLDLTLDGGPVALVELCRIAGGVYVPLPTTGAASDWAREIADVAREGGEAVARLCEALSSGWHHHGRGGAGARAAPRGGRGDRGAGDRRSSSCAHRGGGEAVMSKTSRVREADVDAALASVDAWLEARRHESGAAPEDGGDGAAARRRMRDRDGCDAALTRLIIAHRARSLREINRALRDLGAQPVLPARPRRQRRKVRTEREEAAA